MKSKLLTSLLVALLSLSAAPAWADSSFDLDRSVDLFNYGQVKFRGPGAGAEGPSIVLIQALFGTHTSMNQLRGELERLGARVYTMDLPGTGESASPKREYTIEFYEGFIEDFLQTQVIEPAVVVGEEMMANAALELSKNRPDLVRKVVLLQPTGVLYVASGPTAAQLGQYNKLWNDNESADDFFAQVTSETFARQFLSLAFYDQSLVNDEAVREYTATSRFRDQKWVTIRFVCGWIYKKFAEAAAGVTVPVLGLFGKYTHPPFPGGAPETTELFRNIAPQFSYQELDRSANLPHREQPVESAALIWQFANQN
jgi:pimeloyl-ACP methyl ester carboxylesterase